MIRAALACCVALALGLGIGLVAFGGDDAGATQELRPAGVKLERLAAPAVGAIDVPALKRARSTKAKTTTPPPPPPVTPPPVTPPPVTPPPAVVPPPPPPPPPPAGPDGGRRG